MFVVGSVTKIGALGAHVGAGEHEAFSETAALETTVELVGALDQFLLALVLFIFAHGVFSLFTPSSTKRQRYRGRS